MRLDLTNGFDKKAKANIWIDLKAKKPIRSKINGEEMEINPERAFAIPKKRKPGVDYGNAEPGVGGAVDATTGLPAK